jgi:hypothetical protein
VIGEDLLHSDQVRPSADDQLRDLLQLARVPFLDGLLSVGGWSFEVLQIPRHDREHACDLPAAGWQLLKRHTTPEMAARVVEAIQQRLTIVLQVAEESLESHLNRSAPGVF